MGRKNRNFGPYLNQIRNRQLKSEEDWREFYKKRSEFEVGTFVFHKDFGLGQVKAVNAGSFQFYFPSKHGNHEMSESMAVKSLKILPKNHIKVLKATAMDKLRDKVLRDPVWTFRILILSYDGSITLSEARKELEGSVVKDYLRWIRVAIGKIAEDCHFVQIVRNNGQIAYAYDESITMTCDNTTDLKIINPKYRIFIRNSNFGCLSKKHKMESFYTYIPVKNGSAIRTIKVYVDYCQNCKKFFISEQEFMDKLGAERGNVLRVFVNPDGCTYYGPHQDTGDNMLSSESPLKKAGYSVSKQDDLSSIERRQILDEVILYGIMDVVTVKAYLQFYIDFLGKNSVMEDAVMSWTMDLNYVKTMYSKELKNFFL